MEIIRVLADSGQPVFLITEDDRHVPLPDDFWRRKIPNYRYLTENERSAKAAEEIVENCCCENHPRRNGSTTGLVEDPR